VRSMLCSALVCVLCVTGWQEPTAAQGALGDTRVKNRIRLQVVDATDGPKKATVQFAVDSTQDFNSLAADKTFLATGPIVITVRRFNPLTTSVTVTVNDAADPTHATMGKLVESLLGMATVLGAKIEGAAGLDGLKLRLNRVAEDTLGRDAASTCKASDEVGEVIEALDGSLFDPIWSAGELRKQTTGWGRTIDSKFKGGANGPAAIDAARQVLETYLGAESEPTNDKTLKWAASSSSNLTEALAKVNFAIRTLDDALAKKNPTPCDKVAQEQYRVLRLTNPYERRHRLTEIHKTVAAIRDSLDTYATPARWSVSDMAEFIAKDSIEPTSSTMKNVTVGFSSLTYDVTQPTGALTVRKEDLTSAKVVVRRYVAWIPEIGVGLTFSTVNRPTYGTGTNDAGQTVITPGPIDSYSIDPTIMVNLICGFCGLNSVTPMFQIGTSTSKTTPAIFLGGGFRLAATAKGDFAFGIGWVLPWAKQLKSGVEPGKVIDGTADLQTNLEWRRITGQHVYVNLQYKF